MSEKKKLLSTPMPDLPEDIFANIVKRVADDRWWLLGPILKAGKRGRDVVYRPDVLKDASIYSLCSDPADIYSFIDSTTGLHMQGRYRPFFQKCLDAGNKTAIYYEGLRLVAEDQDIRRGMELLSRNVPDRPDATLACGILSICEGNEEMAIHYLELFGEKHHRLGTEDTRESGEELIRELRAFRCPNSNSYKDTFKYPVCITIPSPECAMDCCLQYGYYENLCNQCYLWWLATRVCRLL